MANTRMPLSRVCLWTLKGKTSPEAAVFSAAPASVATASRPQSSRVILRACTRVSSFRVGNLDAGQGVLLRDQTPVEGVFKARNGDSPDRIPILPYPS